MPLHGTFIFLMKTILIFPTSLSFEEREVIKLNGYCTLKAFVYLSPVYEITYTCTETKLSKFSNGRVWEARCMLILQNIQRPSNIVAFLFLKRKCKSHPQSTFLFRHLWNSTLVYVDISTPCL